MSVISCPDRTLPSREDSALTSPGVDVPLRDLDFLVGPFVAMYSANSLLASAKGIEVGEKFSV
jgi:hypothetical protein